jgi:hypothetical protein
VNTLKPGHLTTEFWIVLLMILCQCVLAALDKVDRTWASVGMFVASVSYTLLRTALKNRALK